MINISDEHKKKQTVGSYGDFTSMYEMFAPQLYTFIFNFTRSKSLTQDIVQETFLKVWIKYKGIDESLSFRSYLFTIAKNHMLNEFRKQLNNPAFLDYVQLSMEEESTETMVEQKIDFDEFNRLLQRSKMKLSSRQAQIFELNKEQGYSVREIAQMLNISEQVVRNQLSLALQILRPEMKKYSLLFILLFIQL
ncbi:sigma-70 family RNA polymerase sigma factor [Dysgonomonas sp. Marseille-P4677]|uniref:RNA polymerase sigma factor n=1 Tax=Dysgonomonas sp. Marseille-P4677 TaxID=2364790 RepID=UPI0019147D34|nr:sigma-70 family RNA polymerase sigma factor [Dysgonomonas sp. Marseille-P4677]MBK5720279.1 sigma-70 family RNA polymerase sigma factor [Dysgonomonas sp. Marseille-P4677]